MPKLETFQTSLRALDALHLAVAYSNSLKLITSDKIFAESAKRLNVPYKHIK
jgi:predicted nucleic acid-binding protein